MPVESLSTHACFGGELHFCRHESESTKTAMEFSVYLPPAAAKGPTPVLYWLSGLTCTAENFTTKAGAQAWAAQQGLILVAPDTSPRGANIEGEDARYDLGSGAGFYVNATQAPWSEHYRMYDYVVEELPELIRATFPTDPTRESISGHSMGGHGALMIALRNPGRYRSVSAFAPICAPSQCEWGHLAFSSYLGEDQTAWAPWDAHQLIDEASERLPLLVDQGEADPFLKEQLHPELLQEACARNAHPLLLRMRPAYDHSYYFIASFMREHIEHHARALFA